MTADGILTRNSREGRAGRQDSDRDRVPENGSRRSGAGKPPVTVTIGGHTYRTTVARMGGRFLVPLSAENRTAVSVAMRHQVVDTSPTPGRGGGGARRPRRGATHDDVAQACFDRLSYTHRKEWVRWTKRPEGGSGPRAWSRPSSRCMRAALGQGGGSSAALLASDQLRTIVVSEMKRTRSRAPSAGRLPAGTRRPAGTSFLRVRGGAR